MPDPLGPEMDQDPVGRNLGWLFLAWVLAWVVISVVVLVVIVT